MNKATKAVTITRETILQYAKEATELQSKIEEYTQRRKVVIQLLEAANLLLNEDGQQELPATKQAGETVPDFNVMAPREFLVFLLQTNPGPVTLSQLREKIKTSGYPAEKFGEGYRYFYTLIPRLVKSGVIQREGGKLSFVRKVPTIDEVVERMKREETKN